MAMFGSTRWSDELRDLHPVWTRIRSYSSVSGFCAFRIDRTTLSVSFRDTRASLAAIGA